MKQITCPNCSETIETDNKIQVTCDNCKYTFPIPKEVDENKEKKLIKINS